MSSRSNNYLDEAVLIRVRDHFFDHPYWESAGKDVVAARGEHAFARRDAAVRHESDNLRLSDSVAAQNASDARGFENDSCPARLIVDHQHLSRMGKDIADFAHDAVGSDNGHVALQLGVGTFVDVEQARLLAAARADDLDR